MKSTELINIIVSKVNDTRQDENKNLENLIRDNYTKLSGDISDIKKGVEKITDSDRAQDIEIAVLKNNIENQKTNLDEFKTSEKNHGKDFKSDIEKINNRN